MIQWNPNWNWRNSNDDWRPTAYCSNQWLLISCQPLYHINCCISYILKTRQKVGFMRWDTGIHIHHSSRFSRNKMQRNLMNPRLWGNDPNHWYDIFSALFLNGKWFGKAVWCSKLLKGLPVPSSASTQARPVIGCCRYMQLLIAWHRILLRWKTTPGVNGRFYWDGKQQMDANGCRAASKP